jgi:phosphoglycolate phosphatase
MPEAISVLAPAETPVARDRLAQSYRDWCTSLRGREHDEPLFPGAAALLLDLASKNDVVLGIATGKSRRGVARFVEENGLGGIFSTIQTADDAPSKPHPAMLHQAMAEAGVTPDMTVMIGDTSYDMMMAVYAKVRGIGVSWGYHSGAELHKYGAMAVMKSFSALESDLHGFLNVRRYEAVA